LRAVEPEVGDVGVILGCGPMGLWSVQALAGKYLEKLIAVDVDDNKLALAKDFGATHAINSKKENVQEVIEKITNGRMADFVIEGTGVPAVLNDAQNYVKQGRGKIALMSSHSSITPEFDFRIAVSKSLEIIATHPDYSRSEPEDFRRAVALINNGTLKNESLVSHEWSLDDIDEAFKTLENKPADFIKGIVVCN